MRGRRAARCGQGTGVVAHPGDLYGARVSPTSLAVRRYGVAAAIVLVAIIVISWQRRAAHDERAPAATPATATGATPRDRDRRADPRTMPRASIAGTVADELHAPIAHARVCVDAASAELPAAALRDPHCVDTDEHGAYVVDGLFAARYAVVAGAKPYRPAVYHPNGEPRATGLALAAGQHRTGIDLVLRAGGTEIAGTVSDVGGGPIRRAQVRAAAETGWGIAVETDDQGHFSLWTAPGTVVVEAVADGYDADREEVRSPGTVALILTPESSLAGTVVDAATGAPVEGVHVELGPQLDDLTDAHGQFTIARLPPGRYVATARSPHRYGHADGSTLVGLGQHVEGVTVRVFPAIQISGHVVIGDARPCAEAQVVLTDAVHRHAVQGAPAGDDGAVVVEGVVPGTYAVRVACRGAHARDHYDPIVVADKDLADLLWHVDLGGTLRGHVLGKSGKPIEDAVVEGTFVAVGRQASERSDARSGKDGAYELAGLAAGSYKLGVTSDAGVAPREGFSVAIAAGATVSKDLVLDDSGTIRGTVVDARAAPVGNVDVFADPHGAHVSSSSSAR